MQKQYERSELLLAARRRSQSQQITWVFSGLQLASLLKDHIDSIENDVWLPHAESIMSNLLAASQCPISKSTLAPVALTALDEVRNYVTDRFRVVEETLLNLNSTSKQYVPFPKDVIGICCRYLANRTLRKISDVGLSASLSLNASNTTNTEGAAAGIASASSSIAAIVSKFTTAPTL